MQRRKHIALAKQLAAALRQLGLKVPRLDHTPPLALREKVYDAEGNHVGYIPAEDDPPHLQWLEDGIEDRAEGTHARKTFGNYATSAGGDAHAIAKVDRITDQQAEHRRRMLAKNEPANSLERTKRKRAWPKGRKMRSNQRGR